MQGQFSYQLQDAFDIYVKYAFNNLIQQGNTVCVQCEHKCNSRWWIKSANVKGIAKSSGRKGIKVKRKYESERKMVTQIIQSSVAQQIVFVNISKWKVYRENFDVDTDLYYGVLQHAINEKWLHSSVKQETKSPISFTLRKKCIQELILCLPVWDWWFPSHEHLYPQGISQEFLWILKAGKENIKCWTKRKWWQYFQLIC